MAKLPFKVSARAARLIGRDSGKGMNQTITKETKTMLKERIEFIDYWLNINKTIN